VLLESFESQKKLQDEGPLTFYNASKINFKIRRYAVMKKHPVTS
jgi:hypothetical protein